MDMISTCNRCGATFELHNAEGVKKLSEHKCPDPSASTSSSTTSISIKAEPQTDNPIQSDSVRVTDEVMSLYIDQYIGTIMTITM